MLHNYYQQVPYGYVAIQKEEKEVSSARLMDKSHGNHLDTETIAIQVVAPIILSHLYFQEKKCVYDRTISQLIKT